MAQRTPNDLCLLCRKSYATQKNSHIIPKFLAKPILGEGHPRASYTINPLESRVVSKKVQDSPKEDYILCPLCEKYFGRLETYMSTKIFTKNGRGDEGAYYKTIKDEGGKVTHLFEDIDSHIVHLFFVSIFWRCSISSIPPFQGFMLPDSERVRVYLQKGRQDKSNARDYQENDIDIPGMPIMIFKVGTDHDHTANMVYTCGGERTGIWQIMVDDLLLYYGVPETPIVQTLTPAWITNNGKFEITLIDNAVWKEMKHYLQQQAAILAKTLKSK